MPQSIFHHLLDFFSESSSFVFMLWNTLLRFSIIAPLLFLSSQ